MRTFHRPGPAGESVCDLQSNGTDRDYVVLRQFIITIIIIIARFNPVPVPKPDPIISFLVFPLIFF
jgi:hypothetical protein